MHCICLDVHAVISFEVLERDYCCASPAHESLAYTVDTMVCMLELELLSPYINMMTGLDDLPVCTGPWIGVGW
jgi:hypothetical protein